MIGLISSVFSDTGFDTTDLLIVLVGLAYLTNQFIESKGWSKSSKRLRDENEDLLRRNKELEEAVQRHESIIEDLQRKVGDLELTNQKAVLDALLRHEVQAERRFTSHHEAQEKHEALLIRAVDALERQ